MFNKQLFPLIPLPNKKATLGKRRGDSNNYYRRFPLIPLPNKKATIVDLVDEVAGKLGFPLIPLPNKKATS